MTGLRGALGSPAGAGVDAVDGDGAGRVRVARAEGMTRDERRVPATGEALEPRAMNGTGGAPRGRLGGAGPEEALAGQSDERRETCPGVNRAELREVRLELAR